MIEKTIATGQIAANDYLVARQEILSEYLERLLALARAAASARFAAGGAL